MMCLVSDEDDRLPVSFNAQFSLSFCSTVLSVIRLFGLRHLMGVSSLRWAGL